MGFFDTFKGNQYKTEAEQLQQQVDFLQRKCEELNLLLTPELTDVLNARQELSKIQAEQRAEQLRLQGIKNNISKKNEEISSLDNLIKSRQSQLVSLNDELLVQDFGIYQPKFDFAMALGYKDALTEMRAKQKQLIKDDRAVSGNMTWQVNGNAVLGSRMVSDMKKLLLRAFNAECDELVNKVKYTNFDASLKKMRKSADSISKLGQIMNIVITQPYLSAKEDELRLAFEYQLKKQEEKEAEKAARAEQREQAKVQKELDEQKKKIEKEQSHYQNALKKIKQQLSANPHNPDLLQKVDEIENQLSDIDKALSDIDYRQANMKAGYVYIISNIGAFGENIYKIGMTRRLDPQDRIDELGDASVPFKFDVHAMIFSDDAPALEATLHNAFSDKKLNMVNQRKEFFNVTLDEIKKVIQAKYDKTVEFIDVPEAEQYRISKKMKETI